jgi:uncharacterized protein (TIGR03435 family)
MLVVWRVRWRRVAAVAQQATTIEAGREFDTLRRVQRAMGVRTPVRIVSANSPLEPGVFGIMRPVLLWSAGITERLSDGHLEAILTHEVEHVRRRDNLAAGLHLVVQSLCWFHPLVWWIGARLFEERERACDEAVMQLGGEPEAYAEGILRTCEFSIEGPAECLAGVTGAHLTKRIAAIMRGHTGEELAAWKKIVLGAATVTTIAVPIAGGVLEARPVRAQVRARSDASPTFDVVSVKTNKSGDNTLQMQALPGRILVTNAPLLLLIRNAYTLQSFQIVDGPDWLNTDRFDIQATAPGNPTQPEMQAMLRRLLADRFKLVAHNDTRALPVYALTVARADARLGPQLTAAAPCFAAPPNGPPRQASPSDPAPCGFRVGAGRLTAHGVTMAALAATLSTQSGRFVLNKTELAGDFDLDLQWTREASTSPDPGGLPVPTDGPSLFTALQEQLGLKLEAQRGPVNVLVVDSVQHPTEN